MTLLNSFAVIMSRASLNLLRSATSSLSPFAATRSYCPVHRRAAIPFRTYSESASEKADKADETPRDSRNAEQKEDISEPAPPLLEIQAKLKTKEDEVLDLTVRSSFP